MMGRNKDQESSGNCGCNEAETGTAKEGKVEEEKKEKDTTQEEINRLRQELEAKTKECEELLDRLRRIMAEFVNYKSKVEEEIETAVFNAQKKILMLFLSGMDDFERAVESARSCENLESLKEGLVLSHRRLKNALESMGVKEIECLGQPFDPREQEAISVCESEDADKEKVVEVCEKGYVFVKGNKKELLRPAKVMVVKPKSKK